MTSTILILFMLVGVIHGLDLNHTCSGEDPLLHCRFDVQRLFIPYNEELLIRVCRRLYDYYDCVADHEIQHDYKTREKGYCGYAVVLEKAEAVIRNICEKGSFLNTKFLEEGTCLAAAQLDFEEYWYKAGQLAELYTKIEEDLRDARQLAPCITANQFTHYMSHYALDKCRKGALIYAKLLHASEFHLLYCGSEKKYEEAELKLREMKKGLQITDTHESSFDQSEFAYDARPRVIRIQ